MKNEEKLNWHEIYVGFEIFDKQIEEEHYAQYESLGKASHNIVVSRNGSLFTHNGEFYKSIDNKERVEDLSYPSSFTTESNHILANHGEKTVKGYGYFIALNNYIKRNLNIDVHEGSLSTAKKLIRLISLTKQKKIELSFDEKEAEVQLEKLGIDTSKVEFIKQKRKGYQK